MSLPVPDSERGQNFMMASNQQLALTPQPWSDCATACHNGGFETEFIFSILAMIPVFFRSRTDTAMKVLAFDSR